MTAWNFCVSEREGEVSENDKKEIKLWEKDGNNYI